MSLKEGQAHRRLLDAVIKFQEADQRGTKPEVRAAAIELEAAKEESKELIGPPECDNGQCDTCPQLLTCNPDGMQLAA